MSNACSLGLAPGMIGESNISRRGPRAGRRRPSRRGQTACGPWWPATIAAWAILTSGGVTAQDAALIERGRKLFMEETFGGNGRTCATCHPPSNNFTVDPAWIRTLKGNDPIFLTGPNMPELKSIEVRNLLRNHALFLENVDGLDQPGVLRSAPHTLALRQSLNPEQKLANAGITHATGWSGDGSPGRKPEDPQGGSLRNFAKGAVIQHFTKSPNRIAGVDFRLPEPDELAAMEAFQLSLDRQAEIDITPAALSFTDDFVNTGRDLFISAPTRKRTGSCNFCHNNAGATTAFTDRVNSNFATGANRLANAPACLPGFKAPFDGGFGVLPATVVARAEVCGKGPKGGPKAFSTSQGDMTTNTPPLIEAADTPPFFHNNSAAKIEDAVAFYTSDIFQASPGSAGGGGAFVLSKEQINQIAAFLRALNVLENIRSSNEYDRRATQAGDPAREAPAEFLVELAIAETTDAIQVLTGGPVQLFPGTLAVQLLQEARELERQALDQHPVNTDLLAIAIGRKDAARAEMEQ
jgi:cytochrome c peroxidase